MNCPRPLRHVVLTAAAIAAIAAGARPSAAAPHAQVALVMTEKGAIGDMFVPEGAKEFAQHTVNARLLLMDDNTFVISGDNLPTITGLCRGHAANGQRGYFLWAKTDQVDLNGLITESTDGSGRWAGLFWIQVNAPRTDGASAARRGSLPPASFVMGQLLVPLSDGAKF